MMSRAQIEKNYLNKEEGELMLAILVKSIKPVFSGSLDHRINQINFVKAKKLEKEQAKNPLVTKYNQNWMGNYDMSRCRSVTDESDKLILEEFGLLDYWPEILYADQTLAKVTGERPGTLRKWPFPLE